MTEWNKSAFAVGTRVRLTDGDLVIMGTVVIPSDNANSFTRDKLWILPDDSPEVRNRYGSPSPMHGWRSYDIQAIQYYHVRYVANGEDIKVFTDLESARAFRDGWNAAANVSFSLGKVKVTTMVTEMQPVEVEKDID